jgi:hypothetical protein
MVTMVTVTKVMSRGTIMINKRFGLMAVGIALVSLTFQTETFASVTHQQPASTYASAKKQYLKSISAVDKSLFSQVVVIASSGQRFLDKKITYQAYKSRFAKAYGVIQSDLSKVKRTKSSSSAKPFKTKYDALLGQYVSWVGSLKNDIKSNRTTVPGSKQREASKAQYFTTSFKKLTS